MNNLTRYLFDWLSKHGLPTREVRVIIEFPTEQAAYEAQMHIKREIEPLLFDKKGDFDIVRSMNGIHLSVRGLSKREVA